jgi:hypothetical protein
VKRKSLGLDSGGKWSEELIFLLCGLEFTVTNLGRGIDEFNLDLKVSERRGLWEKSLSDSDLSLSWSTDSTLDEEEIFVNNTVMWESTDWGNVFGVSISFSGSVVVDSSDGTLTNSVDLVINVRSVIVSEITGSSDCPLDSRWMPGTNTSDLSETSSSLSWKSRDTESLDDTLSSFTSGNGDGINHFIVLENLTDGNFSFEFGDSPVNLGTNISSINLDFHDVGLLLSELAFLDLSGNEDSDDGAILSDSLDISVDVFLGVLGFRISLGVLLESVLLGGEIVLVESSKDTSWEGLGPDGGESSEASWGINITNHTDDLAWWGLDNGDWLDDILLDGLLTLSLLHVSDDVSHTGFVTHEGGEMNWLGSIILWEVSNLTLVVLGSSLWKITEMGVSWCFKLSVRHCLY